MFICCLQRPIVCRGPAYRLDILGIDSAVATSSAPEPPNMLGSTPLTPLLHPSQPMPYPSRRSISVLPAAIVARSETGRPVVSGALGVDHSGAAPAAVSLTEPCKATGSYPGRRWCPDEGKPEDRHCRRLVNATGCGQRPAAISSGVFAAFLRPESSLCPVLVRLPRTG